MPLNAAVSATNRPGPVPITDRSRTGRPVILVVEDEEAVRGLVMRLLKAEGYEVLAVANGRLALPVWNEHRDRIDLLLTDVIMPEGINGRELAERFQRDRPGLKVIYTSGYNMELAEPDGRLRPGLNFVQKPYRPEQLLHAIQSALGVTESPPIDYAESSSR